MKPLRKRIRDTLAALRIERSLARVEKGESKILGLAREAYPDLANTDNPLVSITIPTYNRANLVAERSVPSVLAQSYSNIEVVVVGDHCTDDTAERLAALNDERIRFINLEVRPQYPRDELNRWRVAGSVPINRALFEARGEWIAYMDDDDEALPHRIERSLEVARATSAEIICGRVSVEEAPDDWTVREPAFWATGRRPFRQGTVPHSACMYRSYLRFMLYDSLSYEVNLPTDRQWAYRMSRAGVRPALTDEVFTRVPLRPGAVLRTRGETPPGSA